MAPTPNASSLGGVDAEKAGVILTANSRLDTTVLDRPSADQVIDGL